MSEMCADEGCLRCRERSGIAQPVSRRKQVADDETVALDDDAALDCDWRGEHRTGIGEGVKLAPFSAWVGSGREIFEKGSIEFAAGQRGWHLPRIDARDPGAKTAVDHFASQCARVAPPQRKDGGQSRSGHLLFPIRADIFEKEIAERDAFDPLAHHLGEKPAHDRLVIGVRAGARDRDFAKGQSRG